MTYDDDDDDDDDDDEITDIFDTEERSESGVAHACALSRPDLH